MKLKTTRKAALLASVVALVVPMAADASVCATDPVPAATLLFPYAVFDYNNPVSGLNTRMTIINTAAQAQIVTVVLWSDTREVLLYFNIVLSGYDAEVVDLRDILYFGDLPNTGTAGVLLVDGDPPVPAGPVVPDSVIADSDGTDSISSRCSSGWPGYPDYPAIPQGILDHLRAFAQVSQTLPRQHDDCQGALSQIGDGFETRTTADPTWFYVTVDVIEDCLESQNPTDPDYFPSGVRHDNVLMGEVTWIDNDAGRAEHGSAVHIEADPDLATVAATDSNGEPASFYYYHSTRAVAVSDLREPLPTAWAFRYRFEAPDTDTRVRVWKAPSALIDVETVNVGGFDWIHAWDCHAYTYYAWDDDEQVISSPPGTQHNHLPLATQEVSVSEFLLPDEAGWMTFMWPRTNMDYPEDDFYQVWMDARPVIGGLYAGGGASLVMENTNCVGPQPVPFFGDGFESGDTSAWATVAP